MDASGDGTEVSVGYECWRCTTGVDRTREPEGERIQVSCPDFRTPPVVVAGQGVGRGGRVRQEE